MATPFIPENITVHLGPPDSNARNITLPFAEYIANVASSEIYPTWPENAIRANVYAQVSFALNRIFTEYYRSRGYDFDITNTTSRDQYFVPGRDIFENVSRITDELFNTYVRRIGSVEPLFTQYCNGTTTTCDGLSQWGTVGLAERGLSPLDILKFYFGDDIEIVTNVPVTSATSSVPSLPLRRGSLGNNVRIAQVRLNRISDNYPSIPKISNPDGFFGEDTEAAVRRFQEIFNLSPDGVIGNATWFSIQRIYFAVKRLSELNSEGLLIEEIRPIFPTNQSLGERGDRVLYLQYFLNYLSAFYPDIPRVTSDGIFGTETQQAVIAAQNTLGVTADGIVGPETERAFYNAFFGIIDTLPDKFTGGVTIPYPVFGNIAEGDDSEAVRVMQGYINYIADYYPEIPRVNPTGYFGSMTAASVRALQSLFGLEENGVVTPVFWGELTSLYSDLFIGSRLNEGQYSGTDVGR